MKYNEKLNFWDYSSAVEAIADGFFDSNYNYIPHIGKINAMRVFYNYCCEDDINGIAHEVEEVTEMLEIIKDEAFIEAFNKALVCRGNDFNFANAFKDALRIVDTKKQSWGRVISVVAEYAKEIIASIKEALPEGTMDKLSEFSKAIESGNIDTNAIIQAFVQANGGAEKSGG